MFEINAKYDQYLPIGRLGENIATTVVFDVSKWIEEFGSGNFTVLNRRPTEPASHTYPCQCTLEDGKLHWIVHQADLFYEGKGQCEVIFTQGERVAKSVVFTTVVGHALDGAGDPPEPYEDWVNEVLAAKDKVVDAVIHTPYIRESDDHWMVWSFEDEEYQDTGVIAGLDNLNWDRVQNKPFETLGTDFVVDDSEMSINPDVLDAKADKDDVYTKDEVYTKTESDDLLDDKVDKVTGKGLSTNDYTDAEKTKLGGIEDGAEKNLPNTVVDSDYVHTDNNYTTAEKTKLAGLENYDDTEVKADIASLESDVSAIDGEINKSVVSGSAVSADDTGAKITNSKVNIKTGATTTEDVNLPMASGTQVGLMTPEQVAEIEQMITDIEALKGRNVRLLYSTKTNPTAAEIEAFVEEQGYTDKTRWAAIAVVVAGTYHIWHCYSSGTETITYTWQDDGLDTVNQASQSVMGIVKDHPQMARYSLKQTAQ